MSLPAAPRLPQSITVAVDFSDHSRRALAHAATLANACAAQMKLLHIHEVYSFDALEGEEIESPAETNEARRVLCERLRSWGQEAGIAPDLLKVEVALGDPVDVLVEASAHCDLMVIASHGRRGIQRFLLGSVAERVVRGGKAPVLVVR